MKNLIILDSETQKKNEDYYRQLSGGSEVVYTSYEDKLIRKVRNYKLIGSLCYHILMWRKSYKYARDLIQKDVEIIVCLNPLVGIFLGLFNKKIKIILAGFLFEEKKNKIYYYLRKKMVINSLKNIDKVAVYSKKEVEYYSNLFPEFKDKFVFIHYGLDYDNSEKYKGTLPDKYYFSGGGSNRDYETLVKAIEKSNLSHSFIIATQPWRVPATNSEVIKVLSNVVVETFGDVLNKSEVLVLSLKDIELSAGHMVMLQAMSLGVPIIVNDIPSVRDYVDESMVTFYESQNIDILSDLIENFNPNDNEVILRKSKAKNIYFEQYTSKKLMERLLLL